MICLDGKCVGFLNRNGSKDRMANCMVGVGLVWCGAVL
jgi:hypothetical protein